MRSIQRVAWLSVLLALSAAAQEEAAEVPPEAPPRWSVGAGVGFGLYGLSFGLLSRLSYASYYYDSFAAVGATASLEYVVTPRVSVSFGIGGSYARAENDPPRTPEERVLPTQVGYGAALALGARAFLNDGATRVSLHAFAFGSFNESTSAYYPLYDNAYPGWRRGGAGALAGFAVDHGLLDRLSLRASLDVLGASLGFRRPLTESFRPVPGSEAVTRVDVGIQLSPSFELRLAF